MPEIFVFCADCGRGTPESPRRYYSEVDGYVCSRCHYVRRLRTPPDEDGVMVPSWRCQSFRSRLVRVPFTSHQSGNYEDPLGW